MASLKTAKNKKINPADRADLKKIMPTFQERWGKSASIDLHKCEHDRLTKPELLEEFIKKVVKLINMETHGPCYIDRFGVGDLEGYSAMQFIKTSSITIHLDERADRAFIDIFSCKDFDAPKAKQFAKEFFGAEESKMTVLDR